MAELVNCQYRVCMQWQGEGSEGDYQIILTSKEPCR